MEHQKWPRSEKLLEGIGYLTITKSFVIIFLGNNGSCKCERIKSRLSLIISSLIELGVIYLNHTIVGSHNHRITWGLKEIFPTSLKLSS